MTAKLFEIRDKGTFIPALAVRCEPSFILQGGQQQDDIVEKYLLRRAGYNYPWDLIILTRLECGGAGSQATYDPFAWGNRTMHIAHKFIQENWGQLESGAVICVESILGERDKPKVSERVEQPWACKGL
jgi:hypothetical protein